MSRTLIILLLIIVTCSSSSSLVISKDKITRTYQLQFKSNSYDIAYVNLNDSSIQLFWKNEAGQRFGSFSSLDKELRSNKKNLIIATNAGIFDPLFAPVGLLISNNKVLQQLNLNNGIGNFFLQPNGIFLVDNQGAKIIESSQYKTLKTSVEEATQSGPLLVYNNIINNIFTVNSNNKVVRSGIGVKSDMEVFIVLSKDPVNFYDFASLFRDKLNCSNALYLDGSISKFYIPSQNRFDDGNFSGIIAVIEK